jgi:hypothetical protein
MASHIDQYSFGIPFDSHSPTGELSWGRVCQSDRTAKMTNRIL